MVKTITFYPESLIIVCQSKIYFRGTQYDIKSVMFIVLYSVLIR